MKRLLAIALLVLGCSAPAAADIGYFVVYGYDYPQQLVAGPYADYSTCSRIAMAYGYQYHCVIKAY